MFKLGVVTRGPYAERALALEKQRKGWWPFAYTILKDLARDWHPDDEPLLERIYASLRAGDHVYKITNRGRARILDERLTDVISSHFQDKDAIRIHDAAASNGITSLEWFNRLRHLPAVNLLATDYFDHISIVRPREAWQVVFDAERRPLQLVWKRFVLSCYRREALRYPINRLLQSAFSGSVINEASRLLPANTPDTDDRSPSVHCDDTKIERISLFHPQCIAQAAIEPRFKLGHDNFFQPKPASYEVIRVLNALTTNHFSKREVLNGVVETGSRLVDGGLIALGRNIDEDDGRLRATVFVRRGNRLEPLLRIADGYELEAEVHGARLDGQNCNMRNPEKAPSLADPTVKQRAS